MNDVRAVERPDPTEQHRLSVWMLTKLSSGMSSNMKRDDEQSELAAAADRSTTLIYESISSAYVDP